jgi:hypothetical protein
MTEKEDRRDREGKVLIEVDLQHSQNPKNVEVGKASLEFQKVYNSSNTLTVAF